MIENTYAILIELQTTDLRSSNEFETDLKQKRSKARKKNLSMMFTGKIVETICWNCSHYWEEKKSFKRLEKRSE